MSLPSVGDQFRQNYHLPGQGPGDQKNSKENEDMSDNNKAET